METFQHDLPSLFAQLGLDNSHKAILLFVEENKMEPHQHITEAPCWSPSQVRFLEKELTQDSDWCMAIDRLQSSMNRLKSAASYNACAHGYAD